MGSDEVSRGLQFHNGEEYYCTVCDMFNRHIKNKKDRTLCTHPTNDNCVAALNKLDENCASVKSTKAGLVAAAKILTRSIKVSDTQVGMNCWRLWIPHDVHIYTHKMVIDLYNYHQILLLSSTAFEKCRMHVYWCVYEIGCKLFTYEVNGVPKVGVKVNSVMNRDVWYALWETVCSHLINVIRLRNYIFDLILTGIAITTQMIQAACYLVTTMWMREPPSVNNSGISKYAEYTGGIEAAEKMLFAFSFGLDGTTFEE